MTSKVSVIIEKDEYGYYAYCPELEGCQTQGDPLEEVIANVKEAAVPKQRNPNYCLRGSSCLNCQE